MKTAAVVSSLITVGSLAFAAGQSRVAVSDAPTAAPPPASRPNLPFGGVMPTLPPQQDGNADEGSVAAAVTTSGCSSITVSDESLNWFTEVHRVPHCLDFNGQVLRDSLLYGMGLERSDVDLNGDGTIDHVCLVAPNVNFGGYLFRADWDGSLGQWQTGGDLDDAMVARYVATVTDEGISVQCQPLISGALIKPVIEQSLCDLYRKTTDGALCADSCDCVYSHNGSTHTLGFHLRLIGFRDVDNDGDYDLILQALSVAPNGSGGASESFAVVLWLENTTTPDSPLASDVNRDGIVDGKDLAFVLSAWTQ